MSKLVGAITQRAGWRPSGALILPFLLWLANLDPDLISRRAVPSGSGLSAALSLQGALVFITGIPLVFLPWIAFVLFFAWRFPKTPPSPPALPQAVAIRLASLTAMTMLAVMAALLLFAMATGSALFGITRFAIHYLFPFSPVRGVGALRPRGATRERGAVCAEACASPRSPSPSSFSCSSSAASMSSRRLQKRRTCFLTTGSRKSSAQRGLGNAQFVTLSPRDAGNLAVALPEARALSLSARIEPPPPDPIPDRPCVLLWGGEFSVPPAPSPPANPSPARFLKLLGVAASAGDAEDIEVDWRKPLIGAQRRSVWHVLRGETIEAACRKVAAKGML